MPTRKPNADPPKGKLCRLSPETAPTLDALWAALARDLALPAHFGANRDALWDSLTGDLDGPATIVVDRAGALRAALGPGFDGILAVLLEATMARDDLTLTVAGG
jgi:RNAse (barnase) inhibitor barstar